ncbi:hypothetical protein SP6UMMC_00967, partial [Streptococcus pneumoniae MNZ41]
MNLSLVSPFVYLASEKISAENLFEPQLCTPNLKTIQNP